MQKDQPMPESAKQKIREAMTGSRNPMFGRYGIESPTFGRIHTKKAKQLMSVAKKRQPTRYWLGKKRPDIAIMISKRDTGKKLSDTHKVKIGQAHKGKKHWNWQGGISKRDIHSLNNPLYKEWRMAVFNRDGFKCRIDDGNCSGKLQAHHILRWADYPELRYSLTNGIGLCQAHHPRKRAEEKRLEPVFKALITQSK